MTAIAHWFDDTVIGAFRREWRRSPRRLLTMAAVQLLVGGALGVVLVLWIQR